MEKYICKECQAEVVDGVRTCEHAGTIVLQMEVTVSGKGGCDA